MEVNSPIPTFSVGRENRDDSVFFEIFNKELKKALMDDVTFRVSAPILWSEWNEFGCFHTYILHQKRAI